LTTALGGITLNPNYEILEQIYRLDIDAGAATMDWRNAQKELNELAKRTKASEDLINKTKTDMAFLEGELRRQYKRADELDERKNERSAKLFSARNDDEHRALKREVDNLDRDLRDSSRRTEETEARIEQLKAILIKAENDLKDSLSATADERQKAHDAEARSSGRLSEIGGVRETYLARVDDRISQHYLRISKLTRNPNGPVTRVVSSACGNCHLSLSPQLLNNMARGKDIEFCPSCNHILLPHNQG
jgi:predicted  nucleic acid-binding Zn-ribbon protein